MKNNILKRSFKVGSLLGLIEIIYLSVIMFLVSDVNNPTSTAGKFMEIYFLSFLCVYVGLLGWEIRDFEKTGDNPTFSKSLLIGVLTSFIFLTIVNLFNQIVYISVVNNLIPIETSHLRNFDFGLFIILLFLFSLFSSSIILIRQTYLWVMRYYMKKL
jgi:hypothetical protein